MADIQVTLVLDDSQYTGKISQATASAEQFGNKSKEANEKAQASSQQLVGGIENLKNKFEMLAGAILGVGLVEFGRSVLEYTERVADMAKYNGLAVSTALEFDKAVKMAGGSSEGAARALSNMSTKLQEVRDGSYPLQLSLTRIGVTQQEIEAGGETFLRSVVANLGKTTDAALRAQVQTEFFSKGLRGIPAELVADAFEKLRGTMDQEADAVLRGEAANKRLANAIDNLKLAFIDVFGDFFDKLGQMNQDGDAARQTIIRLGAALATLIVLGVAGKILEMAAAFRELAVAMGIARAASGWIGILITAVAGLAVYLGVDAYLTGKVTKATEDWNSETAKAERALKQAADEEARSAENKGKMYSEITKLENALKLQTDAMDKSTAAALRNIALETAYLTMSQDEVTVNKARIAAYDKYVNDRLALENKLNAAKAAGPTSPETAMIPQYEASLKKLDSQYVQTAASTETLSRANVDQANTVRRVNEAYQYQLAGMEKIAQIQDNITQITMTSDQQKILGINTTRRQDINAALEVERAKLGVYATIDDIDATVRQKIIDRINKQKDAEISAAQDEIAAGRDWSNGWTQAMNQYVEDSTNGFKASQSLFSTITKGMEDTIVDFVNTGQFNFSKLAQSFIDELVRMEVRAAASSAFKLMGGGEGGSILSGIGSLLGFADGGEIPTNGPVLVGERGPEIIANAKGMSVTPNNQLGSVAPGSNQSGGGGTTIINNHISAIDAKGVAQLFYENRQVLFGTVQQAQKELPLRNTTPYMGTY